MVEIAEMTMLLPGSTVLPGAPSYPWAPDIIEAMPEQERKGYLEMLRGQRKEWVSAIESYNSKLRHR